MLEWFTITEITKKVKCTRKEIYNLIKNDMVTWIQPQGYGGKYYVSKNDVLYMIREGIPKLDYNYIEEKNYAVMLTRMGIK